MIYTETKLFKKGGKICRVKFTVRGGDERNSMKPARKSSAIYHNLKSSIFWKIERNDNDLTEDPTYSR